MPNNDDASVTVVLLACDRPVWTEKSLSSVLNQTYGSFRVILSDDSQSTETRTLAERLNDPRVSWVQGPRQGQLANLNSALRRVETPLALVLHDDDWWELNLLERLVPVMLNNPEVDVAFCATNYVDAEENPLASSTKFLRERRAKAGIHNGINVFSNPERRLQLLLVDHLVSPFLGAVFRMRTFQEPIPAGAGRLADYWMLIVLNREATTFYFDDSTSSTYRVHGNSSAAENKGYVHQKWCLDYLLTEPISERSRRALLCRMDVISYSQSLWSIRVGDYATARTLVRQIGPGVSILRRSMIRILCNRVGGTLIRRRQAMTDPRFR